MDQPLTHWYCDVCNKKIDSVANGYIVWHDPAIPGQGPHGFKIIHQGTCDIGGHNSSTALGDYLGADGLTQLLSHLSYGPIQQHQGTPAQPNSNEFVDFIRRLQTPYYEEARRKFGKSTVKQAFHGANEYYPYLQAQLIDIIQNM